MRNRVDPLVVNTKVAEEILAGRWPLGHRCMAFVDSHCIDCGEPLPEGAEVTRLTWVADQ